MNDPYKEFNDSIKAPEALVGATLEKMRAKKEEMAQEDMAKAEQAQAEQASAEQAQADKWPAQRAQGFWWVQRVALPMAACLCLLWVGSLLLTPGEKLAITPFTRSALPGESGVMRGEEPDRLTAGEDPGADEAEAAFQAQGKDLVPGYEMTGLTLSHTSLPRTEETGTLARLQYTNGKDSLWVEIHPFPYLLEAFLQEQADPVQLEGISVYLGLDTETRTYYALWQAGEEHYCVQSDALGESEFVKLIPQVVRKTL